MNKHRLAAPEALDDLLVYRLTRLLAVAGAPVTRLCEGRHGISRREWRLIATLGAHGPKLSSQLAEHMQLDRGRTSRAVSVLVAKHLVARTPRPHDRRLVEVSLTPQGHAIYGALFPEAVRLNTELLAQFSDEDLGMLDSLVSRLQQRAEQGLGPALADLPKADRQRRGQRPPRENPGNG